MTEEQEIQEEQEDEGTISQHDQGKYIGHGEDELGRTRTGHPDLMAETSPPQPDRTAEFVEQQRPHFTTSVDQRNFEDDEQDEQTEGMAIAEDAAPGADAQGG